MLTFKLILTRDVTESVQVTLSAPTAPEASRMAEQSPPDTGWELDEGNNSTDCYVSDIYVFEP